jgi:DNA modification methylase
MSLVQIVCGDALEVLRSAPDNCVQCAITSPPYWSLRDYGVDGQIGLEETPADYVERLVAVFRELRRVLRPDGVFWLNVGDCYARSAAKGQHKPGDSGKQAYVYDRGGGRASSTCDLGASGLKAKDLIGIPWMLAFALRDDGWYLRSECIWEKPNCLPESVKDRPTKSHEQLFLLTKSESYYYDAEPIKEPFQTDPKENYPKRARVTGRGSQASSMVSLEGAQQDKSGGYPPKGNGRNKRSVWRIQTQQLKEAHFAPFPEALVEPCILAGTSEYGCCSKCRAPFCRIVELGEPDLEWQQRCGGDAEGEYQGQAVKDYESAGAQNASATKARILAGMRERRTVGWQKTCRCEGDDIVPCLVLDPFSGSGTTGLVAGRLGRRAILIDLNKHYCDDIARKRCGDYLK